MRLTRVSLAVLGVALALAPAAQAVDFVLSVSVSGDGDVTSSPAGISCPPECSASFPEGTSVTLTATAGAGGFEGWSGACDGVEGETCTLMLSSDLSAGATFSTDSGPPPPPPPDPTPPPPPPPGPGPPPPTPPPGALLDDIDLIIEGLPLANVAFNAPTELALGETAVIQLLISGRRPIRQLQEEITELGEREGAQIRVSQEVEARLTGLGFKIQAVTPEIQSVRGRGATEWRWQIEPTETGVQRLHLTIAAIIDVRGNESSHTIRTFERVLDVNVTWSARISGFFEDNWQWLWTAILVPLAIVAYNRWKRRKVATPPPQP